MGPNFALETGCVDFGQFGYFASVQPPGALTGVVKVRGVNFDFDRDALRPDAVVILDEAIGILKQ